MDHEAVARLSDDELVAVVERLTQKEREASATLVAHLAEMSRRRLHERLGFASLYVYCIEVLRLSPDEAYDRMKAAKVSRRYPQVLELLCERALSLTTIRLLAPHLRRGNHQELLDEARNESRREVQAMLARRFPQPDVPTSIRPLPPPALVPQGPLTAAVIVHATADPADPSATPPTDQMATTGGAVLQVDAPTPVVRPLSPERFHIAFTADAELVELIELARDLLRHAVPGGEIAQIVGRGMSSLVQELLRQKFAITEHPRPDSRGASSSRHIPASVKRTVYLRDRGRCTFIGVSGRRCQERGFVEFHHLVPYAVGGGTTVENIALRCRTHNQLEGEMYFGPRVGHGESEVGEGQAAYGCGGTPTFSVRNENVSGRTRTTQVM
jgi:hypothetical protein